MNETNAGGVRQRSVEIVVPVYNEAHVLVQEATGLALRLPHVHAVHLAAKGRRRALNQAWLHWQSDVVRGAEREFISRSYNLLLKAGLAVPRRTSTPQVPAARQTPEFLPARANASSHLEYAS